MKSVVKNPAPETAKNMFAPPSDNESSNAIDLSKLNPDKSINSKKAFMHPDSDNENSAI